MNFRPDSVYGTLLRSSVVESFTLTETAYPSDLQLPRHSHRSAYFCFVLKGRFTEFYQQQSRACLPSMLIFHPADETHSDYFSSPARCFNIIMETGWMERIRRYSKILDSPTDFHGGFVAQLATRLYKESRQMDELSPLVIEGLIIEIIGETARHSLKRQRPAPPPWLGQAREFLHDQFQECLTLTKVAGSVGVHKTHLSREFRRYYRCTVGEYLRRLRIEFACRKLSASAAPLSEIALAAGFSDQSHFTRTFKAMTGTSPAAYRRALGRPR